MSKREVTVVHLNGDNRCAWHMLAFQDWEEFDLVSHSLLGGKGIDDLKKTDILVLTGYAEEADREKLEGLKDKANTIITYGTCTATGGIFGLANQRGAKVIPAAPIVGAESIILGCPPNPEEVRAVLSKDGATKVTPLCDSCKKTFQQDAIAEIARCCDHENEADICFNNLGIPCNGVVSGTCAQRCVDFNYPCRGCVNTVDAPSARAIGFFGTLAYPMIDVATEANLWGTDKLSDDMDDLTDTLVDVVGTFFRFHLATDYPRAGILESTGNIHSDIMIGRKLEESIQIAATIYGSRGIGVVLNMIGGYEDATGITPSEQTLELRQILRETQLAWRDVFDSPNFKEYFEIVNKLKKIAGNEVLSNVFLGGFNTPIESTEHPFDSYKATIFREKEVEASRKDECCKVEFKTDAKGIIREWSCEF